LFPEDSPPEKRDLIMKAGEAGFSEAAHFAAGARTAYDDLLSSYPTEPNVHYAYGRYMSNFDVEVALQQYQKELEISPNHVQARIEAGYLLMKKGEFETALTYARDAVKLDPKNALPHNLMGRVLFESGRTNEATPELEEAVKLAPNIVDFHMHLTRAYQKSGNKALAAKELDTFNRLDQKRNEALEIQLKRDQVQSVRPAPQ
jgi:tetratricopeptide (TPR) repeat protein